MNRNEIDPFDKWLYIIGAGCLIGILIFYTFFVPSTPEVRCVKYNYSVVYNGGSRATVSITERYYNSKNAGLFLSEGCVIESEYEEDNALMCNVQNLILISTDTTYYE